MLTLSACCPVHRWTRPASSPNRSSTRPTVWSTISATVLGACKRRARGEHDRAVFRAAPCSNVARVKWRLAEQQHKSTSFQIDIRGSRQKAIGCAMSYFSQAMHRAGCHHHPEGGKAARRDSSSNISVGIRVVRHASELLNGQIGLVSQSTFTCLRDDQWVSISSTRATCSNLMPYTIPVAPLIPTMSLGRCMTA